MSTLKLEHIAHIDNAGPDISIDSSGHLNIVNGNLQMGGVTMLDASNGDLSTGNNASFNIRDGAGEVAGRIRNWSSPTNSIAIESDPSNSAADSYLTFTVDGDQKMTILGNNVGIGTNSPDRPLHVTRADGTGTVIKVGNTGTSNATIEFSDTSTTDTVSIGSVGNDLTLKSDDGDISFNTTGDPATASMYIERGGNVGIGTDNPSSGLHIETDTNPVMKVSRGSNNAANINLYYNTTFTGQVSGAAGAFQLSAVGSSTPIQFYTDGTKRMEIDENGNIETAGTYHYEFSDGGVASGNYLYLMSFNPPSNGQSARADINITSGSGIADFTLSCYNGGGTVYLDGLCNGSTRNWLRLIGYSVGNTVHIFFKPKANAYYTPRFQMKWSGYAYRETTAPTSPTDTFTIESFGTSSNSKPYVEAISTTNNYTPTSAGILAYNQAVIDRNGDYNTSTYRFICPANGDYAIEASFAQNNWAGDIGIYKYRPSNGTTTVLKMIEWRIADEINGVPGWSYRDFQHVALGQTAGDELYLGIANITSGGTVSGQATYFSDGYNYSGGGTRYGSIIYRML